MTNYGGDNPKRLASGWDAHTKAAIKKGTNMSALTEVEAVLKTGTTPDAMLVWKMLDECRSLLWQYRDDMRYPPAADSKQRRIEAINKVLGDE